MHQFFLWKKWRHIYLLLVFVDITHINGNDGTYNVKKCCIYVCQIYHTIDKYKRWCKNEYLGVFLKKNRLYQKFPMLKVGGDKI